MAKLIEFTSGESLLLGSCIITQGEDEEGYLLSTFIPEIIGTPILDFAKTCGVKPGESKTLTCKSDPAVKAKITMRANGQGADIEFRKNGQYMESMSNAGTPNRAYFLGEYTWYGEPRSYIITGGIYYNSDVELETPKWTAGESYIMYRAPSLDGYYCSNITMPSVPGFATKEWEEFLAGIEDYVPEDPGGNSGGGGGSGTFNGASDPIGFPGLPSLSAVDTGLITIYAPTAAQMKAFSNYLWSDAFSIDTFKKVFADPMEMVVGLSIVPVDIPKGPGRSIRVGGINSGVNMTMAGSQYATVQCGAINVQEFWGSALDYSPYTKFSIYLPYIGTREIKTDDIMGKTVSVRYNVEIVSGDCTAMVMCGNSVLYSFTGNCACPIPITASNWSQTVTAGIQLAGAGVAAVASGGMTAPVSLGEGAAMAAKASAYTASTIAASKPTVQRSGAVSGAGGLLGIQTPYLIAELPKQSLARDYGKFNGYPSNITAVLGNLEGYTEVAEVQLIGFDATSTELEEIETLLHTGVIL